MQSHHAVKDPCNTFVCGWFLFFFLSIRFKSLNIVRGSGVKKGVCLKSHLSEGAANHIFQCRRSWPAHTTLFLLAASVKLHPT